MVRFAFLFLIFLSSLADAQVYNSRNFLNPDYHTLSYHLKDSILIIGTESGIDYFTKTDTLKLKGQRAVLSYNGKEFYTLDKADTGSLIRRYNKKAEIIDSFQLSGQALDISFGKNSKELFVLVGVDKKDPTGLSQVYRLKKNRKKSIFYTGLPASTSLNLCYSKRKVVVGSAVQGAIFSRNGRPRYSFSTPQKVYVQSHGFGLFSLLHKQSDASAIEVFKTPGQTLFVLRHELDKMFPTHEGVNTHKAVFEAFDVSQETDYILALDQSHSLSIFLPSGKPIEQLTRNPSCVFAFFLHDEVVAWYHSEKKKLVIVQPKKE